MNYMLTEPYTFRPRRSNSVYGSHVAFSTITPGPIEEKYAQQVFGKRFQHAVELGVLVPMPEENNHADKE